MDTGSKLASAGNERGMVTVYVAVLLTMLFAFLAIGVDMGLRHLARTQLQNAADAAALGGACYLPDQNLARFYAMSSAHRNLTAASPVSILNDGSNTLSDSNDVTVGNYNRKLTPAYLPGGDLTGTPHRPVNAVQVQARRTQDTATAEQQSKVKLFFAELFGYPSIGVSAMAIATRSPRAGAHFMIGKSVCPTIPSEGAVSATLSPPVTLSPGDGNMGWTSLLNNSTNVPNVQDLICGAIPDTDVCGSSLFTTGGTASSDFKNMEAVFYDPAYDTKNKTFRVDGTVATWTVIVPVASVDAPANQPAPVPVLGYAKIRMIRACGSGGGGGTVCLPYSAPHGSTSVCSGGENDIVIDWIQCVTCDASLIMVGAVPSLAK